MMSPKMGPASYKRHSVKLGRARKCSSYSYIHKTRTLPTPLPLLYTATLARNAVAFLPAWTRRGSSARARFQPVRWSVEGPAAFPIPKAKEGFRWSGPPLG